MITLEELDVVKELIKLVNENRLDALKVGEVLISKSKHEFKTNDTNKANKTTFNNESMSEQDMLFYSTTAGEIPDELFESFGLTPPKRS